MKVTACLDNWRKDPKYNILWGDIISDTRGRWRDGTRIHTSTIVKIEGDLCYTLNSVYQLLNPMSGEEE